MAYKDPEKRREAVRMAMQKKRGVHKEGIHKDMLTPDVNPVNPSSVNPSLTPAEEVSGGDSDLTVSRRIELLEGEARTFREAFSTLNSLTKRLDALEKELELLKGRIQDLEDSGSPKEYLKSRPGSKKAGIRDSSKRTAKEAAVEKNDEEDNTQWRTSLCPKHGRQPVLGKWVCCGE